MEVERNAVFRIQLQVHLFVGQVPGFYRLYVRQRWGIALTE